MVGPLLIAPLSEIFGRLPTYHTSNILFVAFSIACATSTNLNMLVAFRFLNGMACAPLTLNPSIVGDLFAQEQRGSAMAVSSMLPVLGPVLGPVIGGYLTQTKGWRWTFWLITILAGSCELCFLLFFRETYKVKIIQKKTDKLRKDKNEDLRSKYANASSQQAFNKAAFRPVRIFAFSPAVAVLSIYVSFMYGYLYIVLTTITEVFAKYYRFSQGPLGLTFLGLGE